MNNNSKQNDSDAGIPVPRLHFIFRNREGNRRESSDSMMDAEESRPAVENSNDRSSDSSSDDADEWRRRNRSWLDQSDCSCSDGDETSRHHVQTPRVLELPKPKHSWFVVKEVLRRETGDFKTPSSFTKRFYGSLHAVQRLELMYKLERHSGCVNAINFSKDGTRLISGSDDKLVAVWNWVEGKCLSVFDSGHSSNVFQCKFLPISSDNGHIVTCSRDGKVRLALQVGNGEYETDSVLASHTRACHKISVIQQEPHMVISAGADAQIFSIDIREKKHKRLLFVREKKTKIGLYSVHVNPQNSHEFCVSGEDYFIRVYDRRYIKRNGQADIKFYPHHIEKPHSVYVTCAVYNYNGTEILGSYNDDDIYLFDRTQGSGSNYVHKYEGHRNAETVKGVNFFGPKSEYVISGSDCGHVYLWDKNTEAIVQWKRADEEGVVNCLEPHPRIPVLATSGLDSDVKIWVPSYEQEPNLNGLEKVVRLNREKRVCRKASSRDSINETLHRWWSQIRYLNPRESLRDGQPIFIQIGALGQLGHSDPSLSSLSRSSSSSSSCSSSSYSSD